MPSDVITGKRIFLVEGDRRAAVVVPLASRLVVHRDERRGGVLRFLWHVFEVVGCDGL